ncbi:helix-turn-helix domain-containing protein [Filimonas effusa]|uniref:Helix-turn-helix domain-containing protein n=1 Tax=Filimonas effusa TaxID=2508721 RepID=A0A4Q1D2S0_9BACT|nr:helix-turn-helix transcriptional regulator [Filimonas effusa]RXK81692.1 helix-turn-helix domain-containing protein [Filimonas effusa]
MGFEDRFNNGKQLLAYNCKRIRRESKKRQIDIFVSTNLATTRISEIENGKNNVEFATLYKLKSGLQIDINFLFEAPFLPVKQMTYTPVTLDIEKLNFGRRLLQIMSHLGVSQQDLSIMTSIGEGEISEIVNGSHNVELITIAKIAEALKISLTLLFSYNGILPSNKGYKQELIL